MPCSLPFDPNTSTSCIRTWLCFWSVCSAVLRYHQRLLFLGVWRSGQDPGGYQAAQFEPHAGRVQHQFLSDRRRWRRVGAGGRLQSHEDRHLSPARQQRSRVTWRQVDRRQRCARYETWASVGTNASATGSRIARDDVVATAVQTVIVVWRSRVDVAVCVST